MTQTIPKTHISGTIAAIASKSAAHRLYICAALADRPTEISCQSTSRDIEATKACLAAMKNGERLLPCGESGSTLRFLLPVVAALGLEVDFRMEGRLPDRPLAPLDEQLTAHGMKLSRPRHELLHVSGKLEPGAFVLPGNVSSQYISGLLFALPLLAETSTLTVTGKVESAPYIAMTLDALSQFGVRPKLENNVYTISPTPYHSPGTAVVEGDWSNAAFWLCAGAVSGPVTVTGLDPDSLQGDKEVFEILRRFGAKTEQNGTSFTVSPGTLHAIDIDAAAIPDLVPVLSVVAAAAEGTTRIYNAGRLRIKESDRIKTVRTMLQNLGADVEETADGLIIHGGKALNGGAVDSANDHRIAMSAAIAATLCDVTVLGAEAVAKSYPKFWEDFSILSAPSSPLHRGVAQRAGGLQR